MYFLHRPIPYQMAWLIALNENWLDNLQPQALAEALARFKENAAYAPALDAPREQWVAAVQQWLGRAP